MRAAMLLVSSATAGRIGEVRHHLLEIERQQHGRGDAEIDRTGHVVARPRHGAPVQPVLVGAIRHIGLAPPAEKPGNCIA